MVEDSRLTRQFGNARFIDATSHEQESHVRGRRPESHRCSHQYIETGLVLVSTPEDDDEFGFEAAGAPLSLARGSVRTVEIDINPVHDQLDLFRIKGVHLQTVRPHAGVRRNDEVRAREGLSLEAEGQLRELQVAPDVHAPARPLQESVE